MPEVNAFLLSSWFALLVSFVLSAPQLAGVVNVNLARASLIFAWLAVVLGACGVMNNAPTKDLIIASVVVGIPTAIILFAYERWIVRKVRQQKAPDKKKVKQIEPFFNMLTIEEKEILNLILPLGRSPGNLNQSQLRSLESVHQKTGFVNRTFVGHYDVNNETKDVVAILLLADGQDYLRETPATQIETQAPGIGLNVIVKPQGKQAQWFRNNEFAGTYEPRQLEGFQIDIDPPVEGLSLKYWAHFQMVEDTKPVNEGVFLTTDKGYRLEGFAVELTGESKDQYDVLYMARIQEPLNDTDEFKNGEFCGTRYRSLRIEGIRVRVLPH